MGAKENLNGKKRPMALNFIFKQNTNGICEVQEVDSSGTPLKTVKRYHPGPLQCLQSFNFQVTKAKLLKPIHDEQVRQRFSLAMMENFFFFLVGEPVCLWGHLG